MSQFSFKQSARIVGTAHWIDTRCTRYTYMESQWTEVHRTCDNDPNKIAPISSLVWDPYQDLLWSGNDKVRLPCHA